MLSLCYGGRHKQLELRENYWIMTLGTMGVDPRKVRLLVALVVILVVEVWARKVQIVTVVLLVMKWFLFVADSRGQQHG